MSDYTQKVMWGEGMLLAPQHFQQSERYLEHQLTQRLRTIQAIDWGLTSFELDAAALEGGEFAVKNLGAVLPNGMFVSIPDADRPPTPRPIEAAFGAGVEVLGVFLAIPRSEPGDLLCPEDETSQAVTPYLGHQADLRDETDTTRQRQVRLGRRRLEIRFTSDPNERYHTLPIACLRRNAAGGFELDRNFIPPCQYVSASGRLRAVLRRLLDVMVKKSIDLSSQRRSRGGMIEFTTSEAASFWFLHTINGHIPAVKTLFRLSRVHPLEAYRELAALAGELYSFAAEGTPNDVPPYDPNDLTRTFIPLERLLLDLMGTVLPTRCIPVPLSKTREMLYSAQIHDERLLHTATWYLAVSSDVPEAKVQLELPQKAKLSSSDQVDALIIRALPGLGLQYIESPPSDVPVQQGKTYFQFLQGGEHWDAILTSRSLAIYVPAEFSGLQLELMAVKE